MSNIAVVVPTIREECWFNFLHAWGYCFKTHQVELLRVVDGDTPTVHEKTCIPMIAANFMEDSADLIYHHTDACRNLGFAYIAKFLPDVEYIITLDDDVLPLPGTDPIAEHIAILNKRVPISWLSSTMGDAPYMRGFPYAVREEAPVMVSHGVWSGVPDLDAPTQLHRSDLIGNFDGPFYVGPVPKGALFPLCGMNLAFRREALSLMYFAPMGTDTGYHRFSDIFLGIELKRDLDERNWALYSGGAKVRHDRASNVWRNLQTEGTSLELNETCWMITEPCGEYRQLHNRQRSRWKRFVEGA